MNVDAEDDEGGGAFDPSDMYKGTAVVTLDDENFEKTVLNSEFVWLIKVYSPTCGHCKAMHGEWVKAAK